MSKISSYFIDKMRGTLSGWYLQDLVLFKIIYYSGCRGKENLRSMTKDTFHIEKDHDGR